MLRRASLYLGIAILFACTLSFYFGWEYGQDTCPKSQIPSIPVAVKPPAEKPSQPVVVDRLSIATVRKGEGIENPLIRQLIAEPQLVSDPKEKFAGDLTDKAALKRWAGRQAHLIAIKAGYFDWKFGAQIYVQAPDKIAYLIQKNGDGKLSIMERSATSSAGLSQILERPLATSITNAQFLGWPDVLKEHALPSYEYVYVMYFTE